MGPGSRPAGAGRLATNLNRTPTGYACVIAAFLVAGLVRPGQGRRRQPPVGPAHGRRGRWWPSLVSCAVTYAKFGIPVGLPMADQVWASGQRPPALLPGRQRRQGLQLRLPAQHRCGPISSPSASASPGSSRSSPPRPRRPPPGRRGARPDLPDGQHPEHHAPPVPARAAGVLVTAFRPRALGQIRLARIILVAAAAGTAGVLLWGYISERYMADFMPFLIVAGAIGLIDIWRRLAGRAPEGPAAGPRRPRRARRLRRRWPTWPSPCSRPASGRRPRPPASSPPSAPSASQSLGRRVRHRADPPLLGAGRPALRRQPLLGALPLHRQRHEGRPRPADPALHLDPGRARARPSPRPSASPSTGPSGIFTSPVPC